MDFKSLNKLGSNMFTPPKYIKEECEGYDLFCNPKLFRVSSFKECFDTLDNGKASIAKESYFQKVVKNFKILPCLDLISYPQCSEYCNWHKNFFAKWSMKDFITLMSFAQPQRKLTKLVTTSQKKLAGKNYQCNT